MTNKADVDKVFEGQNVTGVVVALGGKTKDVGPTMLEDGTGNIIAACKPCPATHVISTPSKVGGIECVRQLVAKIVDVWQLQ